MGIQDLFTIVKTEFPDQILKFSLNQWRGHSFAVDISIFLNKYIKSAGDRLWMNTFFIFLCTLKKHGIKAVCVFDGPNPPPEKKAEQAKRRETSARAEAKLQDTLKYRQLMKAEYMVSGDDVPIDVQEKCKILVGKRRKIPYVINWENAADIYDILSKVIEGLEKQIAPITNTHREKAWDIVQMMGLPTFQADGEAETLCAYMCIHGYVDAVLSEDSDVLPYGTPWMLAFKEYKLADEKVCGIYLPNLLEAFDYTMEEFRDLCILLSCDYNSRVCLPPRPKTKKQPKPKPIGIGAKKALELMNKYRCLENIEPLVYDIEPLIYQRCRDLFTPITNDEMRTLIEVKPCSTRPNFERIAEFIKEENLTVSIQYIEKCWQQPAITFCDSSEEDDVKEATISSDYEDAKVYIKFEVKIEKKIQLFYACFSAILFATQEECSDEENIHVLTPYFSALNAWMNTCMKSNDIVYVTSDNVKYSILHEKPSDVKIIDFY